MASKDPKEFLIQHGEKVALGASLAVAAFFVVTTLAGGDAGKTNQQVASAQAAIRDKMKQGVKVQAKADDPLEAIRKAWVRLEAEELPNNWTFYRLPEVQMQLSKGAEPVFVTDPGTLTVKASREKIDVNWEAPPARTPENKEQASLRGYVLSKWRKGDEARKQQFPLGPDVTSYVDTQFEPKTTYCYQVVAHFEFERKGEPGKTPKVIGGKEGVGPEGSAYKGEKIRESKPSNVACDTTAINVQVQLRGMWGKQGELWVWRFWKENRWWVVRFRIDTGSDIGGMVSAVDLVRDNRKFNADTEFYKKLLAESKTAEGKKLKYSFETGQVFLGVDADKKTRKKIAFIEQADLRLGGLGGIDWGYRFTTVPIGPIEPPK